MPRLYSQVGPILHLRPRTIADEPQPHRFAQGFSGSVTWVGAPPVVMGAALVGWGLVLAVAALAMLDISAGFCLGCFTYHQMRRVGILGRSG